MGDKIRIEKMLFEIDYKIADFVSKISRQRILVDFDTPQKISYGQASEILKGIVFSERIIEPRCMSDEEIMKEIVFLTKCDSKYANSMLGVFDKMGLRLFSDEEELDVDLASFVIAKGLLTAQESK